MKEPTTFALLLLPQRAAFFALKNAIWQREPIQGETWSQLKKGYGLQRLLEDLKERLNTKNLAHCDIHVLYDDAALCPHGQAGEAGRELAKALHQLECARWQLLRLEPLRQRAVLLSGQDLAGQWPQSEDWVAQHLLPVLQGLLGQADAHQEREHQHRQQQHEETMSSLRAERTRLQAELAQLQQQIQARQQPSIESLLVCLPAIYRNVWSSITPSDLALLGATLQVPDIPSPFPEPEADTLHTLQQRLRHLPDDERQRLHHFCRNLTHKLSPRPEMRAWLEGNTP